MSGCHQYYPHKIICPAPGKLVSKGINKFESCWTETITEERMIELVTNRISSSQVKGFIIIINYYYNYHHIIKSM